MRWIAEAEFKHLCDRESPSYEAVWRQLFDELYEGMFVTAFRMAHDRELAEDVTAEGFLRLLRALQEGRFRPDRAPVDAYAAKIVRNLMRSQFRKAAARERSRHPEPRVTPEERRRWVSLLVGSKDLPQKQREALALYLDGVAYEEIARKLGIAPVSARAMVCRARKRLTRSR